IGPYRIVRDVDHVHGRLAPHRGAARARTLADARAVDRLDVRTRKVRRRSMAQALAIGVDENDRSNRRLRVLFDEPANRVEDVRKRAARGDALEDALLALAEDPRARRLGD